MILGIIPARYASTRFPGKPLAMIQGKPMIQRVFEQVKKCTSIDKVMVATDDVRIEQCVKSFGGEVIITAANHSTGTERCAEAVSRIKGDFDAVINIQGDEPFILPEQISTLVNCFTDPSIEIATLRKPISDTVELMNPNVVKVITADNGDALYFSRLPVPFIKNIPQHVWVTTGIHYKHIGIYGYRTHTLQKIIQYDTHPLEQAEMLEQLRWLANGTRIKTAVTPYETLAIDTPEDLVKASHFLIEK